MSKNMLTKILIMMVSLYSGQFLLHAQDEEQNIIEMIKQSGIKGGIILDVNCGNGKLAEALHLNDSFIVYGLDQDIKNVETARKYIRSKDKYGKEISISQWDGKTFPFIDNFINCIVSTEQLTVSKEEILRVLTPRGIAFVKNGNTWTKIIKPWPDEIDEWTHYMYDASGNSVSKDTRIDSLKHLQWVAGPLHARHHEQMSSINAAVSARGRVFYIIDEGSPLSPILPPQWRLVARDAFNGTLLWKRNLPEWYPSIQPLKSGPADLPRRLVAVGDKIWVTLDIAGPVCMLDAATGEILKTYENTAGTEEIILDDGILYLVVNPKPPSSEQLTAHTFILWNESPRNIMAVDAQTGETVWEKKGLPWVAPLTLQAGKENIFFYDGEDENIVALLKTDGSEVWRSGNMPRLVLDPKQKMATGMKREVVKRKSMSMPTFFAPKLVYYKGVVIYSGGEKYQMNLGAKDKIFGLDAKTGKKLYSVASAPSGYQSPEDIFIINDVLWTSAVTWITDSGTLTGYDYRTGKVVSEFSPDISDVYWFHHRCYPARATNRFLLYSRTGIEFVDVVKKHWSINHFARGACLYGILPANGMIYTPQNPCACYQLAKVDGFIAYASTPDDTLSGGESETPALTKGSAYNKPVSETSSASGNEEWPMYRHDIARSGLTEMKINPELKIKWETEIGGKLSSPVAADNKVILSRIDTNLVIALDAETGKQIWSFTPDGPVDSSPSIVNGRVVFGSTDGYAYCLKAETGELIWRYRVAPVDRRSMYFGRIESVHPLHGSLLVMNDVVYCTAGRSMFLDGGIYFVSLNLKTGGKIDENVLGSINRDTGKELQLFHSKTDMPTALNDILSSDGKYLYLRTQQLNLDGKTTKVFLSKRSYLDDPKIQYSMPHLIAPTGFLDDTWWHRTYWTYGSVWGQGAHGYHNSGQKAPSGRILSIGKDNVYGYGRKADFYEWTKTMTHHLFSKSKTARPNPIYTLIDTKDGKRWVKTVTLEDDKQKAASGKSVGWKKPPFGATHTFPTNWALDLPFFGRALLVADTTIFVAGPKNIIEQKAIKKFSLKQIDALKEQIKLFYHSDASTLWTVSDRNGKKNNELKLDACPIFDGMAAAYGKLYISTTNGKIICIN